jgi:hypothetical protein
MPEKVTDPSCPALAAVPTVIVCAPLPAASLIAPDDVQLDIGQALELSATRRP